MDLRPTARKSPTDSSLPETQQAIVQTTQTSMPAQLDEEDSGELINVHVSCKLEKADYEHFVPESERLLARLHGKARVLFDMNHFHG
jgi:hypothetical protein